MEVSKDTIDTRISVINKKIMENNSMISQKWSKETLLDAFLVLFEECCLDYLKDNKEVANFIESYRFIISELKKLRINISDFEVLQLIGNGNFGSVHVVKERQTGKVYAMKTIRKAQTLNNKLTCFVEEREIMATTSSDWHTLLRYAFQDSTKLYLVMDYHPGGDLRGLLERQANVLGETEAIFILREIIIAINDLHDLGYIHRDIKPDNILFDRSGHVKLADFGSAARIGPDGLVLNKDNIATGTPEYVAPEVLLSYGEPSKIYGRSCDYWSLGIVAYEMMLGVPPFTGATTLETYNNIIQHDDYLNFPEDVIIDREYITFVKQLLTDELIRPNYEKIIISPLFRDTDWEKIRELPPPFIPCLKDDKDTSLFTSIDLRAQRPNIDNLKAKTMFSGRNLPFIGYTYVPETVGPSSSTGAVRKDSSQLAMKQKQVESLRNRIVQLEYINLERISLEQKYEDSQRLLQSLDAVRSNIEQQLASAMTETSALRRTLEDERNERKDLENRALNLIKSAKERWKAEQETHNQELQALVDSQSQQITELVTWNNELTEKMQRLNETAANCAEELQRLRDIQEQYENKLKNSRDQSRKSFSGLQNQLKLVSDDAESRVNSLKKELEEAWRSNQKLQEQCEEIRSHNKVLETKLKSNEEEFRTRLSERDTHMKELKEEQAMMQSELIAYAEHEHDMQDQITGLQDEKAKLASDYEEIKQLKQERERELENLRKYYTKYHENMEQVIKEEKAEEQKHLRDTIHQLENEVSTLKPQIMEYAANKTKVAELEALVARLEAGKNKDTAVTAREDLLKEQIEKLHSQIKELHETAALADQELNKTKTDLWTKEKALKDATIDTRILARELQDAKNEIKTITEQVKICEDRAKYAEDLVNVDHERAKAAEAKHLALMNENAGLKSRVARLEAQVLKLETTEAEAAELKSSKQELEQKIKHLESCVTDLSKTAETAKHLEISSKHESSQLKAELDSLRTAYAALQESSTILEQQVDGFDRLVVTLKNKESSLELKISCLEKDIDTLQSILDTTKQTLQTARNERASQDMYMANLESEVAILQAEKQSIQEDLMRAEKRYEELFDNMNHTEDEKNQAVLRTHSQQSKIDTLQREIVQLKEETSERLTHLLQARDINVKLHEELLTNKGEIDRLNIVIHDLEYSKVQAQQQYADEISSLATRLQQFEKVSDNLLDRLTLEERKKTALSKLFLKKNPEPARPYTYRELQQQYQKLQSEYDLVNNKYQILLNTMDTPMTARAHAALASAALEDARDARAVAAARLAKAAVDARRALAANETARETKEFAEARAAQEAAEAREAKATQNAILAVTVAEATDERLEFMRKVCGRRSPTSEASSSAVQQSEQPELQAAAQVHHSRNAAMERPRQRSVQLARGAEHVRQPRRQRTPEVSPVASAPAHAEFNANESHCFEHYGCRENRKCRWCWGKLMLLRGSVKCTKCGILVHDSCKDFMPHACGIPEPIWDNYVSRNLDDRSNAPTPSFYLPNTVCWVYVRSEYNPEKRLRRFVEVKQTRINFYLREINEDSVPIESYSLCTPKSVLATDISARFQAYNIDLFLSINFYADQTIGTPSNSIIMEFRNYWDREEFIDAIRSVINTGEISTYENLPYSITTFNSVLELCCMIEFNDLFILGGVQGLYALVIENNNLIKFDELKNVQQIGLLSIINSILIIEGTENELIRIDLNQFTNLYSLTSNHILTTSTIKISNNSESVLYFECTVVNNTPVVCAATAKRIVILHFNSSDNEFQSVRVLDSAEPCSALHIHQNSLIICADKFFNLNLNSFQVHELVDETDPGLAHVSACQRVGTYPVSAICLSVNPPEYMLCYSEFAVFVDQNGRKSRRTQINWKHFPLHFVFCSPNLYIFQFSAIEVLRVCPETNENNRELWTCPPSVRIELIRPKYLTCKLNGVYFSCLKQNGESTKNMREIIYFLPDQVSPKDLAQYNL